MDHECSDCGRPCDCGADWDDCSGCLRASCPSYDDDTYYDDLEDDLDDLEEEEEVDDL